MIYEKIADIRCVAEREGHANLQQLVRRVKKRGTANLKMGSRGSTYSPEAGFSFGRKAQLVIEDAYSTVTPDPVSFIRDAQAKTVLIFDLEYRTPVDRSRSSLPPPSAVYSLYRRTRTWSQTKRKWTITMKLSWRMFLSGVAMTLSLVKKTPRWSSDYQTSVPRTTSSA